MTDHEILRQNALLMWSGFYLCPNTGRILEAMRGDDKVLCRCGRSNPTVPDERTAQTGTHLIRFLDIVTVDEYLAQREWTIDHEGSER